MSNRRKRVRMRSTEHGSHKFGPCEVCCKHASAVWIGTNDDGTTHVFGHENCVRKAIHKPEVYEQARRNRAAYHGMLRCTCGYEAKSGDDLDEHIVTAARCTDVTHAEAQS